MKKYVGKEPTKNLHHFYEPHFDERRKPVGNGRRPVIIPKSQMQSFQIWTTVNNTNKIFMDIETFEFKVKTRVLIKAGEFKGFSGHVVRLKGQTRVALIIEGVGFISTTFVSKHQLEPIVD